jgi:beta-glucosidase
MDGSEIVQLYVQDLVGTSTRPLKELKRFSKISLKAGESKQICFTINKEDLMYYNANMERVLEPGKFKLFIGKNSNEVETAEFEIK